MSEEQRVFLHIFPAVADSSDDGMHVNNQRVSFGLDLRTTIHPSRQGAEVGSKATGGMVIEITTSTVRSLMERPPDEGVYLTNIQHIVKDKRWGWYGIPDFSLVLDDSTPSEYLKGKEDECNHEEACDCGDRVVMKTPESKAWMDRFEEQAGRYCYL
jgi:hypothetical protein